MQPRRAEIEFYDLGRDPPGLKNLAGDAAATGPYGALLRGVHPHHPEIVHNAWHLCVPFAAA
jgi:hypothetical protein